MLERVEKAAAYVSLVLLLVCLIPVMYLGRYNHPTGDDYYYGAETRLVWEETGSVRETVVAALEGVVREYRQWQGTYSALFLMYLPPNIFGDWTYGLVTTVLLLLLSGGFFYLLKPILKRSAEDSPWLWCLCSAVTVLLCVETVPSQGESFFWYNGSMYYTGYFALTLFLWGLLLRYLEKGRRLHLTLLGVLAVFLAGGNYVTLLPCLILLGTVTVGLFCKKDRRGFPVGVITLLMLGGLLVSGLAPGNRVRQDGMWQIPAWKAVAKSLIQGFRYFGAWTGIWWLLAALVLTPFLWRRLKQTAFRFPCPLLVIGYLYGVFCSMSCPLFYTMNSTGPARAVAVIYYGYILFSFGGYVYLLGFICRKVRERERKAPLSERRRIALTGTACAVAALLLFWQVVTGAAADCTTSVAIENLTSGEAVAYDLEYRERLALLEGESETDIVLKPFVHQPAMLYVGDFPGDPGDPTNVKAAQYFRKASVRVEYFGQ